MNFNDMTLKFYKISLLGLFTDFACAPPTSKGKTPWGRGILNIHILLHSLVDILDKSTREVKMHECERVKYLAILYITLFDKFFLLSNHQKKMFFLLSVTSCIIKYLRPCC